MKTRSQFLPLLLLLLTTAAPAEPLLLAHEGRSHASILTAERDAHATVAHDLQRILHAMTGVLLPISHGNIPKGSLFLGTPPEARDAGVTGDLPELAPEEIYLTQRDGHLLLLGGSQAGVSHAVYRWLHREGCRWFMPGDLGEHIPPRSSVRIDPFVHQHRPSFSMRTLWYAFGANTPACGARFGAWARRNCQGADPRVSHGHNFNNLLPTDPYYDEHPDYFALINGQRDPEQICTAHPEVVREVSERILGRFRENPDGPHSESLCPNDGNDFCECPLCTDLDTGQRDPFDRRKPCYTDRLMVFWNAVADNVSKEFPDALLGFYAYVSHTAPPKRETIHPNLAPVFTTQQFCVLHSIADETCQSRMQMKDMLARYCELNDHVYIYEYDPPVGHHDLPSPMYRNHGRSMALYHEMGIQGFSMECHDSWATTSPSHWMDAQLQWDVGQDPDDLMKSYLEDFFGPAAPAMGRYYEALESCYGQKRVHAGWTNRMMTQIYTEENVIDMRQAMDHGLSSAKKDALALRRVLMVDLGLRYLESFLVLADLPDHKDFGAALSAYETIQDILRLCEETNEEYLIARQPAKWLERTTADMEHYLPESSWFRRTNQVWTRFPKTWRVHFQADKGNPPPGWQDPIFDDSPWHRLKANEMWHRQANPKWTGRAWGRCSFNVPKRCQGKKLFLYVGALDEGGTLYLNGTKIHHRPIDAVPEAWTKPFQVEVTDQVLPGQRNILAVAAEAETTVGVLWRPIWLYTPE